MLPALAASLPILLAAETAAAGISLFPEIVIRKSEVAHEWAFSIDEGELACISYAGSRVVFFSEILTDAEMGEIGNMTLPRSVIVSVNPFDFLATVENRELYRPFDTLETLIRRLAPFYDMGRALCDQPPKQDL
ncbi:MAG TPA: hypothetical protein VMF90_07460 [Rhizobiaceae bacterium]|jgi:hypothetical protein|nr:hypothetical protein [Rhizobiaceae bacterium]